MYCINSRPSVEFDEFLSCAKKLLTRRYIRKCTRRLYISTRFMSWRTIFLQKEVSQIQERVRETFITKRTNFQLFPPPSLVENLWSLTSNT